MATSAATKLKHLKHIRKQIRYIVGTNMQKTIITNWSKLAKQIPGPKKKLNKIPLKKNEFFVDSTLFFPLKAI